jgi:hypothetical protein
MTFSLGIELAIGDLILLKSIGSEMFLHLQPSTVWEFHTLWWRRLGHVRWSFGIHGLCLIFPVQCSCVWGSRSLVCCCLISESFLLERFPYIYLTLRAAVKNVLNSGAFSWFISWSLSDLVFWALECNVDCIQPGPNYSRHWKTGHGVKPFVTWCCRRAFWLRNGVSETSALDVLRI